MHTGMEESLKNEKVAKKAAKDQKTSSVEKAKDGELNRGKDATKGKRKRDEEGGMTSGAFNINVPLNSGANGLPGGESVSPKRAKQTARRGGSKVVETESSRTPARPKYFARRGGSNVAESGSERGAARPKQTARYSGPPRGAAFIRGRATPTSGRSTGTAGSKHEVSTSQSSHGTPSRSSRRGLQTARCTGRGGSRG